MESSSEVLEQESPPPVRRGVWIALVVVLLLGAAAWAADELRRTREDAALTDCRTRLLSADRDAATRLGRVADYLRPSLANLPRDRAHRLADPMRSPARLALPGVRAAALVCRDVAVWSWHEPGHARRDDTVAYADALLARLQAIAADGGVYFDADAQLSRLQARADLS